MTMSLGARSRADTDADQHWVGSSPATRRALRVMADVRSGFGIVAILSLLALLAPGGARADGYAGGLHDTLGTGFSANPHQLRPAPGHDRRRRGNDSLSRLLYWNAVAIDASGLDHTPVAAGEDRVFGEQLGPGRASRAMAIVHIAIFEAVNAFTAEWQSFTKWDPPPPAAPMDAALRQPAHPPFASRAPP